MEWYGNNGMNGYNSNCHGHNGRMAMGTMVQWANGFGYNSKNGTVYIQLWL